MIKLMLLIILLGQLSFAAVQECSSFLSQHCGHCAPDTKSATASNQSQHLCTVCHAPQLVQPLVTFEFLTYETQVSNELVPIDHVSHYSSLLQSTIFRPPIPAV